MCRSLFTFFFFYLSKFNNVVLGRIRTLPLTKLFLVKKLWLCVDKSFNSCPNKGLNSRINWRSVSVRKSLMVPKYTSERLVNEWRSRGPQLSAIGLN